MVSHTFSAVLALSPQTIFTCWKDVPQQITLRKKHLTPSGSLASRRSMPTTWLKRYVLGTAEGLRDLGRLWASQSSHVKLCFTHLTSSGLPLPRRIMRAKSEALG